MGSYKEVYNPSSKDTRYLFLRGEAGHRVYYKEGCLCYSDYSELISANTQTHTRTDKQTCTKKGEGKQCELSRVDIGHTDSPLSCPAVVLSSRCCCTACYGTSTRKEEGKEIHLIGFFYSLFIIFSDWKRRGRRKRRGEKKTKTKTRTKTKTKTN